MKNHFACVVEAMFADKKVSKARITSVYAFALYIQDLYHIDLTLTTTSLLERYVYGWFATKGDSETTEFPSENVFPYLEWDRYGALILLHRILSQHDDNCVC